MTTPSIAVPPLSLPEELQLALPAPRRGPSDSIAWGFWEIGAAAVIDLALAGRLGPVDPPSTSTNAWDRKIRVTDPTPTGIAPLDVLLEAFVARDKPWKAVACITRTAASVSSATAVSLAGRGLVVAHGRSGQPTAYLEVVDADARRAAEEHLRSRPADLLATDDRAAILLDIWRQTVSAPPQPAVSAPRTSERYPDAVRYVIEAALESTRALTAGE
ncbi:GPP34 family phosphoprotein [Glaciihabitans sp. dw_435]|uniref:GPP34 family phosphoprotein n=1 Tax=Glaciihabitans sp. dw_435 TaxID=2720081 RepID=UPI001BD29768|nr:GPP34 family phosphoprotein [Glaciihabitans sp. dw_435]